MYRSIPIRFATPGRPEPDWPGAWRRIGDGSHRCQAVDDAALKGDALPPSGDDGYGSATVATGCHSVLRDRAEGTGVATLNDSLTVWGHIPSNVLVAVLCEKQEGGPCCLGAQGNGHTHVPVSPSP
jgi:hypothetical protein